MDEDYDTIERIARNYGITVGEVLSWNPCLVGYRPDEVLPANLPIVLLMPDDEGEEPSKDILPTPIMP
ncbi:unnamed protein product [Phytomonas sp. EM1]|nr:unnamed protein product [Phytomonas sp. EM1]|eukprot:CCW64996.1 unnamed protein product [Phytomonas sp. isolate EM1]